MKVATIDIGTNTTRLAIVESSPFKVISKYRTITRLGEHFNGTLSKEAMERVIRTIESYTEIIKKNKVDKVRAVATSVVREAKNSVQFISSIRQKTGINIDIVDGETEASLTFKGVLSVLAPQTEDFILLDIGGGSNEFSLIKNRKLIKSVSLKFGVVFLYEKFIKNDPPLNEELSMLTDTIRDNIFKVSDMLKVHESNKLAFVGTAGTVTTLAAIKLCLNKYNPAKINNCKIDRNFLMELLQDMVKMKNEERGIKFRIEKGREDVILPGLLIVRECMELFKFKEIIAIDSSLLEGIAFDLLQE